MRRWFLQLLVLVASLLLSGCGAGSDSEPQTTTSNRESRKQEPIKLATFLDSPVKGAKYQSGDLSGVTDENGVFKYREGRSVKLYAGDIFLGEATPIEASDDLDIATDMVVTPLELTKSSELNSSKTLKLVRFLMAIDADNDPENGIDINSSMTLLKQSIAVDDSLNLEEMFGNRKVPPKDEAIRHLANSLKVDSRKYFPEEIENGEDFKNSLEEPQSKQDGEDDEVDDEDDESESDIVDDEESLEEDLNGTKKGFENNATKQKNSVGKDSNTTIIEDANSSKKGNSKVDKTSTKSKTKTSKIPGVDDKNGNTPVGDGATGGEVDKTPTKPKEETPKVETPEQKEQDSGKGYEDENKNVADSDNDLEDSKEGKDTKNSPEDKDNKQSEIDDSSSQGGDSSGSGLSENSDSSTKIAHKNSKKRGILYPTTDYKEQWFEKAKEKWNIENPDNQYSYNYYTYEVPEDADRVVGTPPDSPITPKEWMQKSGLGFSKPIDFPYSDSNKYHYTDAIVKEWKAKGFRNGRFHLPIDEMVDLDKDPTGATLNMEYVEQFKKILQIFVDNDIPVTVSFRSHGDLINNMSGDREETFRRIIEWWRQLSSALKNMSYLVAFENFVEYHGFDDIELEKRSFQIELDNGETHYEGFKNYRKQAITNWVRSPGYNNLMAEISKVVRLTNPKRIFIYKPNGIGRAGMVNITPWRWGAEGDYLGITNQRTPYWLISVGGSANLKLDYIKAIRSSDDGEREELLNSARRGTWGPGVDYYNGTHIPVWISLFGIKVDDDKVESELNGEDVSTDEIVSYLNWYLSHIQNDLYDENGIKVTLSAGFQQTWWIWDFQQDKWFEGTLNNRWEKFEKVVQKLSEYAKKYSQ